MPENIGFSEGREERNASVIGVVEAVSPGRIEVAIHHEAPHGTGLREGTIYHFPRINSYVVLPSETGNVLAIVTWIGIENEQVVVPTQRDQIGLPTPKRRLHALPLGVLSPSTSLISSASNTIALDRGIRFSPTVGDPVRLPTRSELKAALPSVAGMSVPIGKATLSGNAEIGLDPNRLFGRHLAVFGNTGSGKSCSVVHLIRSCLTSIGEKPKAFNVIILDINGEYAEVFNDTITDVPVSHFSVFPKTSNTRQFRVPYWLWNFHEWLSLSQASSGVQAPLLRSCLSLLRAPDLSELPGTAVASLINGRRVVKMYQTCAIDLKDNPNHLSELDTVIQACDHLRKNTTDDVCKAVDELKRALKEVLCSRRGSKEYPWKHAVKRLETQECETLLSCFDQAIAGFGMPRFSEAECEADLPVPFDERHVVELLPLMAAHSGSDAARWVATLVERLRISMADQRQASICARLRDDNLEEWLRDYAPDGNKSQLTIIDLSLVPTNVVHVVVAVFTRVLLEAMERCRLGQPGSIAPRILVVEEAHSLIRHPGLSSDDEQQIVPAKRLCREAFERVAREGRKFGLSLVVSSQRPSELSETVLSQCNTFIVHRIVNDQDQRLIRRLIPDSLGSLTAELPALPTQTALIVGWALDIPALVRIADLDESQRPRSADPNFTALWTGESSSTSDWTTVVKDWQQQ